MLIISDVRLLQEALAAVLLHAMGFTDIRCVASLAELQARLVDGEPMLVMIDSALDTGLSAARLLQRCCLSARVIAFGVDDSLADRAAWSDAGVSVCLSRSLSLTQYADAIAAALASSPTECARAAGSGPCRAHLAGQPPQDISDPWLTLTARENEVVRLILIGESNKEIAHLLDISVATVKSHVHNLLRKLGVERRGKLAVWPGARQFADAAPAGPATGLRDLVDGIADTTRPRPRMLTD